MYKLKVFVNKFRVDPNDSDEEILRKIEMWKKINKALIGIIMVELIWTAVMIYINFGF